MDFNMNFHTGCNHGAAPPAQPPNPQLATTPTSSKFNMSHHYVYKPVHHQPAEPNPWTNPQHSMKLDMTHHYGYEGARPHYQQPAASNNPWTNPQPHYHVNALSNDPWTDPQPHYHKSAQSNNPWTNPQPHYGVDVVHPSRHSTDTPLIPFPS